MEIWKPFRSGAYEVSNLGRVRRATTGRGTRAGRLLTLSLRARDGYFAVMLWAEEHCTRPVHQIVAEAFLGPRPTGKHTNHINGDKRDNRPENLEYITQRQNADHAMRHRLYRHGVQHWAAKLSPAQVILIRGLAACGPQEAIATAFGVTRRTIGNVLSGRRWSHV